jgi:hypothetical protein
VSGIWVLLPLGIVLWFDPGSSFSKIIIVVVAVLLAPLPALLYLHRQRSRLVASAAAAEE